MKKGTDKAYKFLSCLDSKITRQKKECLGLNEERHREILKIEIAQLNAVREKFVETFCI
ncbi:MAG: hypothetical protein ABFR82_03660 [Nitrospirota bacterium]